MRRVRRRVGPAGVEISEVVTRPRRGRVRRARERDVSPVSELVECRSIVAVLLLVGLLADVAVAITRPERCRLVFCEAVCLSPWSWGLCRGEADNGTRHEQRGYQYGGHSMLHGRAKVDWWGAYQGVRFTQSPSGRPIIDATTVYSGPSTAKMRADLSAARLWTLSRFFCSGLAVKISARESACQMTANPMKPSVVVIWKKPSTIPGNFSALQTTLSCAATGWTATSANRTLPIATCRRMDWEGRC